MRQDFSRQCSFKYLLSTILISGYEDCGSKSEIYFDKTVKFFMKVL